MAELVASAVGFALGLLLLPAFIPGVRVRGMGGALKVGVVCGLLSVLFGKLLVFLLSLVFLLPILLTGPIARFVIQCFVNAILLSVATKFVDGIEFDRRRSAIWAAVALTILQMVVRHLV
jgi:uncharacterized membrane protein YvlD (DUF360 family)